MKATGALPEAVVACVGGGSNAIGMFAEFLPHAEVQLFGVEAAGDGVDERPARRDARRGQRGVLHGMRSYVLRTRTAR